jgi:hypothetical protein
MPFGPHPCDDPNHGKTVGPVDMVDVVANADYWNIDILIHAHP